MPSMPMIKCPTCSLWIERGSHVYLERQGWRWLPWMVTMIVHGERVWQHAWFCPECAKQKAKSLQDKKD